jgi:cell division protease FtsH
MSEPINYATPYTPRQPKFGRGLMGWLLFVALAAVLFVWLRQSNTATVPVPLSTVYREVSRGNVNRIFIDGDDLTGNFTRPVVVRSRGVTVFRCGLPPGLSGNWSFVQWLMDNSSGAEVNVEPHSSLVENIILPLIPWLLILAFIWFFVFRQLRRGNSLQAPMRVVVVDPEQK